MAVVATLGVAGCGGDSSGSEQPAACESLAAVQKSMDQVQNTNVSENGLAKLKSDLQQLRTDLQQLVVDAQAQFATQVDAVKVAVDNFAQTITAARAAPNRTNLATVRSAFATVRDSVRNLGDAMASTC